MFTPFWSLKTISRQVGCVYVDFEEFVGLVEMENRGCANEVNKMLKTGHPEPVVCAPRQPQHCIW